jgi:plasmid stabilization system protein ParE
MYNIVWTNAARADRFQIMDWYETILLNLAKEFDEEVSWIVREHIAKYPKIARIVYKNARKYPFKRFPYNLIYTVDELKEQILILAIVHNKREPKVWIDRVN